LVCRRAADLQAAQQLLPALSAVLRDLGLPRPVRVIAPTPNRSPERCLDNRPAWIAPNRWQGLPAMLRAALIDSSLEGGAVRTATPYLTGVIESRYMAEMTDLLAEAARLGPAASGALRG